MASVTFCFNGKVALVTGANSGIGAEAARQLAASDCWLALVGRDKERLDKVGQECQRNGLPKEKVHLIIADLTSDDDIRRIVQTTIDHFGKLDILVNNAAIFSLRDILGSTIEQYDELYRINLRAVVLLTNLCVSHLIKTKGSIVNVSSVSGSRPYHKFVISSLLKSALDQFTRVSALELAPKQVRVNSVSPGSILTPIQSTHIRSGKTIEEILETAKSIHPLGRIGEPAEVAKAILFLASDAASFTTGEILQVAGGRQCMCPR